MPTQSSSTAVDNEALAEQVYDSIMASIEPDLLTANIPALDAHYAAETKDEHEARMERYRVAYKKFDIEMSKFLGDLKANTRHTHNKALKEKEEQDRLEETNTLHSLASAFA